MDINEEPEPITCQYCGHPIYKDMPKNLHARCMQKAMQERQKEAKNEYEIKAIVDGVIIERHIAKTLAEAESIANKLIDEAGRADTDIKINKIVI